MEEIPCIFCGVRSQNVAITENGYTGLKCIACNLIYVSPRPGAAKIENLYTDEHAFLYADAQFKFERVNRLAAAATLSKIRQHRKGGSVLELGPGGGQFLLEARKCGFEPYAIELNPIEAHWIKDGLGIPCERSPLSGESFNGRRFDLIYHKDVLSHLHDPITVFSNINNALEENGLLVFETGNIADVDKRFYKHFSQFLYPDHLFFFGERSIDCLLERTGFRRIDIKRDAILLELVLQKALWRLKGALKEEDAKTTSMETVERPADTDKMSVKRRLRSWYRYVNMLLVKLGVILPKRGRPLKLLIFAEKKRNVEVD
jgi:SAM-dependent methyltransferase